MKKAVITAVALTLALCLAVGGTLAWLMDKTQTVTNTFTAGDVDITLTESPKNADGTYGTPAEGVSNQYQAIPGTEYKKDPKVTVAADSEDCWLFVKFEEVENPATYYTYTSTLTTANKWTQGDGTKIPSNVWYREVKKTDTVKSWELLDGNKITVKGDAVTKDTMDEAVKAELIYTAYAAQKANLTAEEAWKLF